MEKDIPISQEKNTKAARLREASRRLQELSLERQPTAAEWDAATTGLTQDDLAHLDKLAEGYRERALDPEPQPIEDRLEEAASALKLRPDVTWTRETLDLYRKAGWTGPEVDRFLGQASRRLGRRPARTKRRWIMPLLLALVAVPAGVGVVLALGWSQNNGLSPVQGPRNLEASFDTQGVKANIGVSQSRMLLFPDATVAEVSAWVTFPEHRVEVWEGTVSVLDGQGQVLTKRDVTFHASNEGPLEPGQGVAVFEQFDAHPFYDKVTSFQVTTTKILAQEAHPKDRRELPVQGLEALTAGYNLKVWVVDDHWADRFASKVHTLSLELENTGLKPFAELQFALLWRDAAGKTLKTLTLRPVSAFRTALPSGARLPWTQESVFDTEVFQWAPGEEPHPVLELREWQ